MDTKIKNFPSPLAQLSVAKWLKIFLLIDAEEMRELFTFLDAHFLFYQVQRVIKSGEGILAPSAFLQLYEDYVCILQKGEIPPDSIQREFSLAMSVTNEALYALSVEGERQIIKPILPIIQLQANRVRYTPEDHSFRCPVFGVGTFSWGIQIAYPQIYQNPETHEVSGTDHFPNAPLFKAIQKWVRNATRATPFLVKGKKQNEPIRLGKKCFSWINNHPELKPQNISIYVD